MCILTEKNITSFVDGIHVGKFVEKLQDYLNKCTGEVMNPCGTAEKYEKPDKRNAIRF